MNLLEIVKSFENLSENEQDYLLDILLKTRKYQQNINNSNQESF